MTNFSQQQPVYILKLSCVLIGQNLISESVRVFFKLAKASFAFCHSVTSFHFGQQCRVKKILSQSLAFQN